MKWSRNELDRLFPILEQITSDLFPVDGKNILVMCSASGEMAFWLAEMMETGKVTGLELDEASLDLAHRSAREMGLLSMVEFMPAEMTSLPVEDASFDALVSEFIVYPTTMPTRIGQLEMARVLKPGGKMILTDVILIRPLPAHVRQAFASIGLDYLCDGSAADFRQWMTDAGLVNIKIQDLTSVVRPIWEDRWETDLAASHEEGYSYLLEDRQVGLGKAVFYLYVYGEKPGQ